MRKSQIQAPIPVRESQGEGAASLLSEINEDRASKQGPRRGLGT